MIRKQLITIVALTAMVAMIQTAQATITLADLAAGGTISVDDKTFSGFSYQASGLSSFDASKIIVTATYDPVTKIDYLMWSGNISLASGVTATADLKLNYIVTATAGTITTIDQMYVGSSLSGLLTVDETAATGAFGGTVVGYSHLQIGDLSDPPAEALDLLNIVPPQNALYVTKDMGLAVINPGINGGFVTISQVAQSFHQIPEPTTMIAGALLLLPFGASTLRILRKNRTA